MVLKKPAIHTLHVAVLKLLRPLVRLLLRNGIPFRTFADLVKWVYVDVASKEFGIPGRKQSKSRISIITGLSRKEVLRMKKMKSPHDDDSTQRYNRAARVVSGWVRDPRFADKRGRPAALPFEGGKASFSELVRAYSGDVPVRAVIDELLHVGTIRVTGDDRISLTRRAYIPYGDEVQKLDILGTDVADLISTIQHNITREKDPPFFQRKVAYDNIPGEVVPTFRKLSGKEAQQLLEKMDRWLAGQDRDTAPSVKGTGKKRIGIGIYYFEEDLEEQDR